MTDAGAEPRVPPIPSSGELELLPPSDDLRLVARRLPKLVDTRSTPHLPRSPLVPPSRELKLLEMRAQLLAQQMPPSTPLRHVVARGSKQ